MTSDQATEIIESIMRHTETALSGGPGNLHEALIVLTRVRQSLSALADTGTRDRLDIYIAGLRGKILS